MGRDITYRRRNEGGFSLRTKAYSFGNAFGRNWPLAAMAMLVIAAVYIVYSGNHQETVLKTRDIVNQPAEPKEPTPSEIAWAQEKKATEERLERCTTGAAALRKSASVAMNASDPQKAFEILNPCNNFPIDAETKALLVKALNAARANDEKTEKTRLASEKARRKKQGANLAMTPQEVIESSWGKPRNINRSTYTFGTREQWVYGNGNYLYFKDGILDSIQN